MVDSDRGPSGHAPIYTGQVNGYPVRFFKTPLEDGRPDFVWHSVGDLENAIGLSPPEVKIMART
jgi:hypothetical protein